MQGPTLQLSSSSEEVVDDVIQFRARWILHDDGELEMGAAVADSLQEMREILVQAQRRLALDHATRQLLGHIEEACAKFLHRHPGIDRRDFEKAISEDELDDLYELRLEAAEVALHFWDEYGLTSAQDLANWIKIGERPRTPWLPPPT